MAGSAEEEWLRELDVVREAHELEMHKLRMSLQERTERIDYLKVDRERMRQGRELLKENHDTEIKRLRLAHATEIDEFKRLLAGATYDRAWALTESRNAWESFEKSRRELEAVHRQLSDMKNSNQMLDERLDTRSKGSHSAQEAKAATQRSLCQGVDENGRAVLPDQQRTGELDDLRRRLEVNDVQLTNLRNALRREGGSLKEAKEENRVLKEDIAELKASRQRAVDETSVILQSLKGETEAKVATQRLLHQEEDEKDRALSQNERLRGELGDLKRQLDNNDIELKNIRRGLQHEEKSYKRGAEENRRLKESLKQEQEDRAATQLSLRQEAHEKAGALSRNEQLTAELEGLRRQMESKDNELRDLRNALHKERPSNGGAEENLGLKEPRKRGQEDKAVTLRSPCRSEAEKAGAVLQTEQLAGVPDGLRQPLEGSDAELVNLRSALQRQEVSLREAEEVNRKLEEEIVQLRESHRKATDDSTTLSQLLKQEQEGKMAAMQSLRRWKDEEGKTPSQNERRAGELDDLRRRLEISGRELINARGALEREQESFKGAAEEIRKLKLEVAQLSEPYQRAINESTTLLKSLSKEREDKEATERSLRREMDEKGTLISRNDRLTGELDNLRNALQHEEMSSRRVAEENRKLQERVVQLEASYRKTVDASTMLSQSLRKEREDKAVMERSLRQEMDEKTGELGSLKHQLEGNDVEFINLRNALRHEEVSSKTGIEENQKLQERIIQLEASYREAVDKSVALSESLRQEQEDKAAALRSMGWWKEENGRVRSQNKTLTEERDDLKRQLDSDHVELKDLQNALQHEEESCKGAAEEVRKLKDEVTQLRESRWRAIDESATLLESVRREQEANTTTQQSLRREKDERGRIVSQNQRLTGELDGLRNQLENKEADLRTLRNALQQEKESLKGRVEDNWALKEEVAKLKASHRRAVDESKAFSYGKAATQVMGEHGGLRHQLEGKEAELNNLRSALEQSQTKHDELTTLLETRTRELKGAQVYLTKADTLSGAEVIALVNALNVEILQTSAFISDSFDYTRKPAHADGTKVASARISEFIGSKLARLISTVSHSDNDLLVQIALQSAAVELSHRIILTWNFDDLQAEQEQPLVKLYNNIREIETQAVGGRWRALARAHAQMVALQEGNSHATMVSRISDTLVGILVAARCTKSYEETRRTITDNFGEHISGIVKMALRLNKAIGEEVTSADLRPVNVTSGKKFDESTMADFESGKEDLEGQIVLCTTALGMQRSERVARGDAVEFETTILLKPKVAVESVVDAVDVTR